jgi:microcin C transport system permease protein
MREKTPHGRAAPADVSRRAPLLKLDPLTRNRIDKFKSIKRGIWSFRIMVVMILISLLAELFINSRALVVVHQGRLYLPTYAKVFPGTEFGLDYAFETNYRDLARRFKESGGGWILMPPVPYNPYEQDFRDGTYPPYPPSREDRHYLGTDRIGRDIVARLVYGFRIAILFALLYVLASFTLGTVIGCLMGYWGGAFDIVLQRVIEIWEEIPFLYVVMIVSAIFQPGFLLFVTIYVVFGWSARTWSVRAMTYRERERDYILAARSMGAGSMRIVTVHIVPNVLVVVVTMLPFAVEAAISSLTALDYLGFGLRPPTPSWGDLISQGIATLKEAPWILSSVAATMTLVLVMIAFIGEGLRDAFDPKKFTVYK